MNRFQPVVLVLVSILALPALAYRREYSVTVDGQRKAGSEVCFYRGIRGSDGFALFFTPGEVRCLPADSILDFPPGLIHVFARHKDGFASVYRDFTVYEGPPNPERGYEKLEIPLLVAGLVDFSSALRTLQANQRLGIWIAASPKSSGTFVPLVRGESTVFVPADMTVFPLLLENGVPVAVGDMLYLQPRERHTAIFKAPADTSDVIVWTHVDSDSAKKAEGVLRAPEITLQAGKQTFRPVIPLYRPESFEFLFFRGVPRGKATVSVTGTMWQAAAHEIAVQSKPVTVVREAMPLVAGGAVELRWSTEGAPQQSPDCLGAQTRDVPLVRAALLQCKPGADGKPRCTAVRSSTAPYEVTSSLMFTGVPPGTYTVGIEPPYGKRQSLAAEVVTGRATAIPVTFPSFSFYGKATVNGKPIHARLIFFTGQAVSDDEGRYTAIFASDPMANQVAIEPCDGSRGFRYIATTGPAQNAAFDLDVRLTNLTVEVTDPQRRPVPGASVRFSPIKHVFDNGKRQAYFGSKDVQTNAEGEAAFDDVPKGFLISACASHPEYMLKCSNAIDLAKVEENRISLQFDPIAMRGRVEGHTGWGVIAAVNPARVITERFELGDDGTFRFLKPHASPEYLVYISNTRPLYVLPLPLAAPENYDIRIPAAPMRAFTVTVPSNRSDFSFVGIWIGGMYVPVELFNTHMEMRGLDSVVHGATPLRIPDIAATGPISAAFAVPQQGLKEFVDPFTLPQYASVQPQPVNGDAVALTP